MSDPRNPAARAERAADVWPLSRDDVGTPGALCPICRAPIVQPATGRPRRYCSEACRRVAEHERRRLDRRLLALESERDRLLTDPPLYRAGTVYAEQECADRDATLERIEPACMSEAEVALWQEADARLHTVQDHAERPCVDCPVGWAALMRREGRCNGEPGPIARPIPRFESGPLGHRQ